MDARLKPKSVSYTAREYWELLKICIKYCLPALTMYVNSLTRLLNTEQFKYLFQTINLRSLGFQGNILLIFISDYQRYRFLLKWFIICNLGNIAWAQPLLAAFMEQLYVILILEVDDELLIFCKLSASDPFAAAKLRLITYCKGWKLQFLSLWN